MIDAVSVADELLEAAADRVRRALAVETALPTAGSVSAALAVASREPAGVSVDTDERERVDENVILRVDDADSADNAEASCVPEAAPEARELALADDERDSALEAPSRDETLGELDALADAVSLITGLRVGAAARVAGSDGTRSVAWAEDVDTATIVRVGVVAAERDWIAVLVREPVAATLNDADADFVRALEPRDVALELPEASEDALPPPVADSIIVPMMATLVEPDEEAERVAKDAEADCELDADGEAEDDCVADRDREERADTEVECVDDADVEPPLEIVSVGELLDDAAALAEATEDELALPDADRVDTDENEGLDVVEADVESRDDCVSVTDVDGRALVEEMPVSAPDRLAVDVAAAGSVTIDERLAVAHTDPVPPIFELDP